MDFATLAEKIAELEPAAKPSDVAQIATLLLRHSENIENLNENQVEEMYGDIRLRLNAACDQHAAMAEEIQSLACSDPRKYSPDQVWILIRAIKVQSQMLEMYAGGTVCSIG